LFEFQDEPQAKRTRTRRETDIYVAQPSGGAKMNLEMSTPAEPLKRKRDKKKKGEKLDTIVAELKANYSRSAIANKFLPGVIEHTAQTKEGRAGIGRIIAKEPVICSNVGTSKAATNRRKRAKTLLQNGLDELLEMGGENNHTSSSIQSVRALSATPMMEPRDPRSNNALATLPQRIQMPSYINAHPSSTGRIESVVLESSTNPQHQQDNGHIAPSRARVTAENLAGMMSSDDESADSDNSQRSSPSRLQANIQDQRKLGRKSMTYKTKQKRSTAVEAVRKSLGDATIKNMRHECRTVRERRPILALVALKHNRKDVNNAVNVYTNKAEWNKTKIHAHFPGPLKPVKKTHIQRLKVSTELLAKLLTFLDSSGNLQRAAFGRQVKDLLDGLHTVEMDNVSRLKNLNKLVADYLTVILAELDVITTKTGEEVPPDESRCTKLDQKTPRRCMKPRSHEGDCAFTPKGSICAGTVRALVDSLTVGDIKSLSGLDDVKVLKGRDNFARLRDIAKQVLEPDEAKPFIKQCDDVELFYQTDYVPHLQRDGTHKCNCLTCGFNDKGESHRRRQISSFFCQRINSSQERVSNLPVPIRN
jgi:hypothetical protein